MGNIRIGWAEESIVPDKKVSLDGQFFERISEYVESDITATAMAIEADGEAMIMVSVDVVFMDTALVNLARKKFTALTRELNAKKLMICATHTHNSLIMASPGENVNNTLASAEAILAEFLPEGKEYRQLVEPDEDVITPQEAGEFVTDKIAQAAFRAWESRKTAMYANEFGRATVGMCRRVTYDDGSGQMWGDTNTANFVSLEGGNDSGIELIYTFDTDKKLTGVVANITCPAQILEQRSFISGDYWGRTKAYLREEFGNDIYLLALCGAAGDQCPRDLVRWVEPETPIDDPNVSRPNPIRHKADPSMYDISGCNRVGRRIANEILTVYKEIEDIRDEAVFIHEVIEECMPLRKVCMKDYEGAVAKLKAYIAENSQKESFNFADNAKMQVYAGIIKRYREQQYTEVYPIEYHVIRLGDIAIATNPFEMFLDYGNRIKARSFAEQTFIVQLCCGAAQYLPTEKAEKAGHYSAYVASGYVGHEGGDLLVRNSVAHINALWKIKTNSEIGVIVYENE